MATGEELSINGSASAVQMANAIFGTGVSVKSASYVGATASKGIWSGGDATSPGVVPSDSGVILSTGRVVDFTQSSGDPNRFPNASTDTNGPDNVAAFNAAAGTSTHDASYLNIDFIPSTDTITIRFVFASEEFPEVMSGYNDLALIRVNGVNVPVGVGDGSISIDNLSQANLVKDNTTDAFNTEMDGFTVTLSLTMKVNVGVVNSLMIGIADVGDAHYNSALLIAGDSIQAAVVAKDDEFAATLGGNTTIDVLANDQKPAGSTLTITHVNGVPVTVGSTVTLPSGDSVTVNADGTLTFHENGQDAQTVFTYQVSDGSNIDTGIVTLDSVPCFVAGTRILTPSGPVAVESLCPGDMVETADDGPQPLRWIGRREVAATGRFAPVAIAAGAFGEHGALRLSPQHRVMIRAARAELLFGEEEVLAAARDLVDGRAVRMQEGGRVTYVHLLFDRHQIVFAEGLATESYLPGPLTARSFAREVQEEILALFPELDFMTGAGYGPAARPLLRGYEVRALGPLSRPRRGKGSSARRSPNFRQAPAA